MLRRLSHPRIVQYYECITDAKQLYIVLEYVENGSLSDILRKFGRLPEQLVIRYIAQVLEALDFLHERAIIHRDIKGANVLVTKDGHVKLADFGVARLADDHTTKTQSVAGTPYWSARARAPSPSAQPIRWHACSWPQARAARAHAPEGAPATPRVRLRRAVAPEIIEMSAFTTASDIWSVGCTVLELLTGVPPHFELTQMSAMYHIVNDAHPPLPDGLTDELRDFLMKCFVKDVHRRARASELRAHPWLTSSSRSHLALSRDISDSLPAFMTHTVDHETSWLSSEGTPAPGADDSPAAEELRSRLQQAAGGARTPRARVVSAADKQRRLAAAAGQGMALPEGAPATEQGGGMPLGTDAGRVSPGSPFNSENDLPLCGFLWKRGTSSLGKLAYYKRYFYLKQGALCYCSGRTDSTIQQSLEKQIPLTSISSVDVSSTERFEFHMRCDSRLYQFRSRTLREMQVWVETLKEEQLRHQGIFAQPTPAAPRRQAPAFSTVAVDARARPLRHSHASGLDALQPAGSRSPRVGRAPPPTKASSPAAAASGPPVGVLRPVLTR